MYVVEAVVRRVVDGDTIVFDFVGTPPFALRAITQEKKALRLWGVDAPESHYQGQSQGAIGEQATRALRRLVGHGDRVRIHTAMDRCESAVTIGPIGSGRVQV